MRNSLEKVWIHQKPDSRNETPVLEHEESNASLVSLGDTHIWRENGDRNV
jgi:hypothetical protein